METRYLIVDDDQVYRERLVRAFKERGFQALGAADAEDALVKVKSFGPDRAVLDLRLPDRTGLELVQTIREASPQTEMVMLTGYGSIATALQAVRAGATNYLTKPADVDQILHAFEGNKVQELEEDLVPSLSRVEWEHIQRVLADCDGNVSQAAKLLGLHRRTLQRKLSKLPGS